MSRAQSIVVRDGRLLMVRHRHRDLAWWCLPGGAIEANESPAEAAIRELQEECGVDGVIVGPTSVFMHDCEEHHSSMLILATRSLGSGLTLSCQSPSRSSLRWIGWDSMCWPSEIESIFGLRAFSAYQAFSEKSNDGRVTRPTPPAPARCLRPDTPQAASLSPKMKAFLKHQIRRPCAAPIASNASLTVIVASLAAD
jgi:ADP-ribose pyrophosphatase YjhB (NUDIX family)